MLSRTVEREQKGSAGRPRDAHRDMWAVADIFGDVLDSTMAEATAASAETSRRRSSTKQASQSA